MVHIPMRFLPRSFYQLVNQYERIWKLPIFLKDSELQKYQIISQR
jgi:hypothetical protein